MLAATDRKGNDRIYKLAASECMGRCCRCVFLNDHLVKLELGAASDVHTAITRRDILAPLRSQVISPLVQTSDVPLRE